MKTAEDKILHSTETKIAHRNLQNNHLLSERKCRAARKLIKINLLIPDRQLQQQ